MREGVWQGTDEKIGYFLSTPNQGNIIMNRRKVLQLGTVGAAGALFIPTQLMALSKTSPLQTIMGGGLYYTKEQPGRWARKAGGHSPAIERKKNRIEVTTPHPMNGFKHYIVKHMILNHKFEFVSEHRFDPRVDEIPVSQYDIGRLNHRVFAVSVCNKHDTWVTALDI